MSELKVIRKKVQQLQESVKPKKDRFLLMEVSNKLLSPEHGQEDFIQRKGLKTSVIKVKVSRV